MLKGGASKAKLNFKTIETGDSGGALLDESPDSLNPLENEQSTLKRKLSSTSHILDGDATPSTLDLFETNDAEDDIKSKSVDVNGLQVFSLFTLRINNKQNAGK